MVLVNQLEGKKLTVQYARTVQQSDSRTTYQVPTAHLREDGQSASGQVAGETIYLLERTVVIVRDDTGFGFTVSEDPPVLVRTVKQDGAAWRVSVRPGDRILKVNGVPVEDLDNLHLASMISGDTQVVLSMLGRPLAETEDDDTYDVIDEQPSASKPAASVNQQPPCAKPNVTKPVTLTGEKKMEWRKKRLQIISQMIQEEQRHEKELQTNIKQSSNLSILEQQQIKASIQQAQQRIKHLQAQSEIFSTETVVIQDIQPVPLNGAFDGVEVKQSLLSTTDDDKQRKVSSEIVTTNDNTSKPTTSVSPLTSEQSPLPNSSRTSDMKMVDAQQADVVTLDSSSEDEADDRVVCPLFYLITDLYQNCNGTSKELRKWAYEIHSTFLVPTAPLQCADVDGAMCSEIGNTLAATASHAGGHTTNQERALKYLFVNVRSRCLDDVNDHLNEFRGKRSLGLGHIFGENMLQGLTPGDRGRELKVADALVTPHFEACFTANLIDYDALPQRAQASASGLATVIKYVIGYKPACSVPEKLLDKCPTFVTKDKSGKFKLKAMAGKKTTQLKVCDMTLHKQCVPNLTVTCLPTSQQQGTRSPRPLGGKTSDAKEPGQESALAALMMNRSTNMILPRGGYSPSDKSPCEGDVTLSDKHLGWKVPAAERTVGRSQSMKTRGEEDRRLLEPASSSGSVSEYNSKSGGSGIYGRRAKSDVNADDPSLAICLGEPQRSRHSRLLQTDSLLGSGGHKTSLDSSNSSIHSQLQVLPADEARRLLERVNKLSPVNDADLNVETDIPPLESVVDRQLMELWPPKEKKRQDVINELLHTERTHVRNLKVLVKVFYTPMLVQQVLPVDITKYLFGNIEQVLEAHTAFNERLKRLQRDHQGLIAEVGEVVQTLFAENNDSANADDGSLDEACTFSQTAAVFCQNQQHALEVLKTRQKKDATLTAFLQDAHANPYCARLQLKDMLPMEMQRLTKYPLLLETIAKYTTEPSDEYDRIKRCVAGAKTVLDTVNEAKRSAENTKRLEELQRRMDSSPFDKENHAVSRLYRGIDLRRQRLIKEGQLSWRLSRSKTVDLHVVLQDEILVLLTRHSDGNRLLLRYHDTSLIKQEAKWCPLLKLTMVIPKPVAVDKNAFFLVYTSPAGPQIYELVAHSATEKQTWFKVISDQVDFVKKRFGSESDSTVLLHDSGVSEGEDVCVIATATTHGTLVNRGAVSVAKPAILEFQQPQLTPLESLRKHDDNILKALVEKQQILAQLLSANRQQGSSSAASEKKDASTDELNKLADQLAGMDVQQLKQKREPREVTMSAIVQANRLLESINDGMKMGDRQEEKTALKEVEWRPPSVSCLRLTTIAASLMKHLTAVLQTLQQREDELMAVKQELQRCKNLAASRSPALHPPPTKGAVTAATSAVGHCQPSAAVTGSGGSAPSDDADAASDKPPPPSQPPPQDDSRSSPDRYIYQEDGDGSVQEGRSEMISPHELTVTQPPVTLTMPAAATGPASVGAAADSPDEENKESSPEELDLKRKEKRLQKRQRHVAAAAALPATSPTE